MRLTHLGTDYVGDVGQVGLGYCDAFIGFLRSPYDTAVFLGTYADNPGAGVSALGQGVSDLWGGLSGTDPRAFGNSLGTVLITAATMKAVGVNAAEVPEGFRVAELPAKSLGRTSPMSGEITLAARTVADPWQLTKILAHEKFHQGVTAKLTTVSGRAAHSALYHSNPIWRIGEEVLANRAAGLKYSPKTYLMDYGFRIYDLVPYGAAAYTYGRRK